MVESNLEGVFLTPLKVIKNPKGDLFHALKASEASFQSFGEAYFSSVVQNEIKGWKKHNEMKLNLVVISGEIQFVLYDERPNSRSKNKYFEVRLSLENYQRLTVPPGIWLAFKGISSNKNLLLNLASIEHDPKEASNKALEEIKYEW